MTIYLVGSMEDHFIVDELFFDAERACQYCDKRNATNRERAKPEWWVVKEAKGESDSSTVLGFIYHSWRTIHSKHMRRIKEGGE